MLVTWHDLNERHLSTAQCAKGAERKRRQLAEEELRQILERAFQAYREPLDMVTSFKYLGRVFMAGDGNWTEVSGNLQKARKSWVWIPIILSREGEDSKVLDNFFKAVVQAVFLFGAETWFLTPRMEQALRIFQHRFARSITGRHTRRREGVGHILRWRQ